MQPTSTALVPPPKVDLTPVKPVEAVFVTLPVRADMFQSGRFKAPVPAPSTFHVNYTFPFIQKPRLNAWALGGTPPTMTKIPSENILITLTGLSIINDKIYILQDLMYLLMDTQDFLLTGLPSKFQQPTLYSAKQCV